MFLIQISLVRTYKYADYVFFLKRIILCILLYILLLSSLYIYIFFFNHYLPGSHLPSNLSSVTSSERYFLIIHINNNFSSLSPLPGHVLFPPLSFFFSSCFFNGALPPWEGNLHVCSDFGLLSTTSAVTRLVPAHSGSSVNTW